MRFHFGGISGLIAVQSWVRLGGWREEGRDGCMGGPADFYHS